MDKTIAYPYAKAFLEQSLAEDILENAYRDMESISKVGNENPDLVFALRSPLIHLSKKKEILKDVFEQRLHPKTLNLLYLLVAKERASFLFSVAAEFSRQYQEYHTILEIEMVTAFPINSVTENKLLNQLESKLAGKIKLRKTVDSDLIGGILIKIGDYRYDGSIRKNLVEVKKCLMQKSF